MTQPHPPISPHIHTLGIKPPKGSGSTTSHRIPYWCFFNVVGSTTVVGGDAPPEARRYEILPQTYPTMLSDYPRRGQTHLLIYSVDRNTRRRVS